VRALLIFGATDRLSSNDALIAAVALDHGIALVSAGLDFREIPQLALLPPDSAEAARLV
jgi:predicted nucleic acid-binding protein